MHQEARLKRPRLATAIIGIIKHFWLVAVTSSCCATCGTCDLSQMKLGLGWRGPLCRISSRLVNCGVNCLLPPEFRLCLEHVNEGSTYKAVPMVVTLDHHHTVWQFSLQRFTAFVVTWCHVMENQTDLTTKRNTVTEP